MTDSVAKTSQLDFNLRTVMAPKYKYVRIPMNNHASASVSIRPTTTELLEWKLPTQVYNLSRSYISYSLEFPAVVSEYTQTFEDTFDIAQSATFGSAGGIDIVNIQHLQNYVKIARKIATPIDDFLGNDNMSQLYSCNSIGSGNPLPFKYDGTNNATKDGYLDTKYISTTLRADGTKDPAGATGAVSYAHRQFPLGGIPGTLFAVDRDFYSPVEQYLRITAGIGNKIAYTTLKTNEAKPDAGSTAVPDFKINQCYLYLAIEENLAVSAYIRGLYHSGQLTYRIPYTTGFKNTGAQAAGDTTNIQIQISQQYGKRLKRILHTVWNSTEELNTAYDCANWNGSKIESYQTFLDSLPLQDRILSCKRPAGNNIGSDDWAENKKFLDKRSCITSKEMYAYNWFHIDQWYEPRELNSLPDVNRDDGLVMDTPKSWTISTKSGAAGLVHYTWVEFSRDIEVTVAGPQFK